MRLTNSLPATTRNTELQSFKDFICLPKRIELEEMPIAHKWHLIFSGKALQLIGCSVVDKPVI